MQIIRKDTIKNWEKHTKICSSKKNEELGINLRKLFRKLHCWKFLTNATLFNKLHNKYDIAATKIRMVVTGFLSAFHLNQTPNLKSKYLQACSASGLGNLLTIIANMAHCNVL